MMTDTRLIPLADLEAMLASVMAGRAHLAEEPFIRLGEGEGQCRPLPPDKGLRLGDFLEVLTPLPDPCPATQAAQAVVQVLIDRGHHHLLAELDEAWTARWPGSEIIPEAIPVPDSGMRCAWCGNQIPLARGKLTRFCTNSHRVAAVKRKKRVAEQAGRR